MQGRWLLLTAVIGAGLLCVRPASAEDVHLTYDAPAGCPDRQAFAEQVASRTQKAQWVEPREGIRTFDVRVTVDASSALGKLVISDPDAAGPASREVPGSTCDEVVGALALITALAIDPSATLAPVPQPPDPPPPSPPTPKPKPPSPPKPRPAPKPKPKPKPEPEPEPKPDRWRWLVGAGLRATTGLGDKLAVVVPGYLELALDADRLLAPSFRLGVSVLPDRVLTHPLGRGHLSRFSGRLSGCPITARLGWLMLRPCASFEAGALLARGEDVAQPQTSANPWLAVGAGGQIQVFPVDWLMLEVEGEVGVSLVRHRFVIEPAPELGEGDLVLGQFGGGVGIRFP